MPARIAPSAAVGRGRLVKRAAAVGVALAIAAFAVQGGEWGTFDLIAQKRRIARLEGAVDSLQHVVDSLKAYRRRLETDPALQERIAREEFGMVRGSKELLYRFTEPAAAGSRP
jgi:cell division protein FtsB